MRYVVYLALASVLILWLIDFIMGGAHFWMLILLMIQAVFPSMSGNLKMQLTLALAWGVPLFLFVAALPFLSWYLGPRRRQ